MNAATDNEAAVKEEETLPYMLAPAIDRNQVGQQILQQNGSVLAQGPASSNPAMNPTQFLPQASNSMSQGQGFGDKSQQCELHASFPKIDQLTDDTSSRL